MNDKSDNEFGITRDQSRPDDAVAKLMILAGPRAEIPTDIESRVHASVRDEWLGATRKSGFSRWAIPVSLAATVLVAIAFSFRGAELPIQPVGLLAQIAGPSNLSVGGAVYPGDVFETTSVQGLSIALKGDVSLRLGADTAVRIESAEEIHLISGQIYADSGDRIYRDRHITVHTPQGSATDVGTQFAVTFLDDQASVAVREGRVDVVREQSTFIAQAGEKLTLRAGQDAIVSQISSFDPSWAWAISLAPGFEIENKSLLEFLKWVARESGKSLIFSDDEVRMAAMGTELFGSVSNFTPLEAIESVLATTQFKYELDERSITISK